MELKGERLIPVDVQHTWDALNDADTLKACIPGCESLQRTGDNSFESVVAVKIGPVNARFKGKVHMTNVNPPTSYTLNFDGQGGAAGFGKGSADVALAPEGTATKLRFDAKAQVGGKMAQIGSRLIDATAEKLAEQFFSAFEAHLSPPRAAAPAGAHAGPRTIPVGWWIAGLLVLVLIVYFTLR
jgi:uncharacterized protein